MNRKTIILGWARIVFGLLIFSLIGFEPRSVEHRSVTDTVRALRADGA